MGQHRVLIFAQRKVTLDIIESLLLGPSGISYLRLDGAVAPKERFGLVQQFNSDPTVDVMLLTTAVGGLGLNLTAADTVVFYEHDWNPMKDLQAMDRAHRLGQKKVVNVYRLLTKATLEERVMSMQQFKVDVANAVISSDNISTSRMETGSVLDIMADANGGTANAQNALPTGAATGTDQYADFDVDSFARRVASQQHRD